MENPPVNGVCTGEAERPGQTDAPTTHVSITAHLAVVVAALAVTRHIETSTRWSIKQFVRTARRYRTVQIRAGSQILTTEDPLPDD